MSHESAEDGGRHGLLGDDIIPELEPGLDALGGKRSGHQRHGLEIVSGVSWKLVFVVVVFVFFFFFFRLCRLRGGGGCIAIGLLFRKDLIHKVNEGDQRCLGTGLVEGEMNGVSLATRGRNMINNKNKKERTS